MNHTLLGIETSCDDTAVCVLQDHHTILSHQFASQINLHAKYGGIVPEIASRQHASCIHFLVDKALQDAHISFNQLDAIAVTKGPGLEGSLLVGITYAKTLAHCLQKPLIGVNHLHGHIYSTFLETHSPTFPFVALIISGGHTQLSLVTSHFDFTLLGSTRDDAVGEAFDKVARTLGYSYPGGPSIEHASKSGNPNAFSFPKPMLKQGLEFSFSGLKTAVIQTCQLVSLTDSVKADIAASFQQTVIDLLLYKALAACRKTHCHQLLVCGGVSANSNLKHQFIHQLKSHNINVFFPRQTFCTDNAAMIACAGSYMFSLHQNDLPTVYAMPNLDLNSPSFI